MNEQEKARAERLIEKFSKMDDEGKMFLCAYADGMLAAAEMLKSAPRHKDRRCENRL